VKVEDVKNTAVIGFGVMGAGIVQVLAQAGYQVGVRDVSNELLQRGLNIIKSFLSKSVEKGKMKKEDADAAVSRIKVNTSTAEIVKNADFIVEAVFEDMDLKKKLFKELDEICPKHTILATNTSMLSVSELAKATKRPDKVVGMHFFNPVPLMKLVEVIKGDATSEETVNVTKELSVKLGKVPVVAKDSPGFIVNRVAAFLFPNEGVRALAEGVATKEDIDTAVKLGMNFPMGPLELLDLIGIDTAVDVMESMYKKMGDPKWKPHPLLMEMKNKGLTGRKAGKGFYTYK